MVGMDECGASTELRPCQGPDVMVHGATKTHVEQGSRWEPLPSLLPLKAAPSGGRDNWRDCGLRQQRDGAVCTRCCYE